MNNTLYFISILIFFACANGKKINTEKNGKIVIIKPYCGGAKPSPEVSKGIEKPFANSTFLLKSKMNNDKKEATILKIKTDKNGLFKINIPNGTYFLIHETKTLSFEKFKEYYLNKKVELQEYIGDDEARKIYSEADFEINITDSEIPKIEYREKCFIGYNPILKYVGPLPK